MRFISLINYLVAIAIILAANSIITAQSADQNFPTPVTTNEIAGTIKARDIGDPRLTTYFYEFGGDQGDVFINVVTRNFDGDIDIFTADALRPLSKIVIYSDAGAGETGRIVYLRKPERILLRVQGRSPDDLPATFRIKFAGSFIAMRPKRGGDAVKAPEIGHDETGEVLVNSVGTRIEAPPKPKIEVSEEGVEKERIDPKEAKVAETKRKTTSTVKTKPPPPRKTSAAPANPEKKSGPETSDGKEAEKRSDSAAVKRTKSAKTPPSKPETDPMASFRLLIEFKDGKTIERPMTEVVRFGVDRGTLTVVYKDGIIGRYSMVIVAKVTVESP